MTEKHFWEKIEEKKFTKIFKNWHIIDQNSTKKTLKWTKKTKFNQKKPLIDQFDQNWPTFTKINQNWPKNHNNCEKVGYFCYQIIDLTIDLKKYFGHLIDLEIDLRFFWSHNWLDNWLGHLFGQIIDLIIELKKFWKKKIAFTILGQ